VALLRSSCRFGPSLIGINNFIELAQTNKDIASAVEDLEICLPTLTSFPANLVRITLSITTNISDLIIKLPRKTPPTIFTDVFLPNLVLFVTNLPHATIFAFTLRHRGLRVLHLGICNRSIHCPLGSLDLNHIEDLRCPLRCARNLIGSNLRQLHVENTQISTVASSLLRSWLTCPAIQRLTIDVFSDDYALLNALSHFCPNVRHLKLIETARPTVRICVLRCLPPAYILRFNSKYRHQVVGHGVNSLSGHEVCALFVISSVSISKLPLRSLLIPETCMRR
jgi:hypothetical protein